MGGVPARLGDLPGPVSQLAWSPDSTRIVVVCRVGVPDRAKASAADRNAPRVVRGLAARLDGVGWQDGRRASVRRRRPERIGQAAAPAAITTMTTPSFSPDGATIVFASDRTARRDDRQFRSDAWVLPTAGGRPRRLTNGKGRVSFPVFSPDGKTIAFAGQIDDSWNADNHVFVVPADGSGAARDARARPRSTGRPVPGPARPDLLDRATASS